MRVRILIIAIIVAMPSYWGWSYFNKSLGVQKTSYNPSVKECFSGKSGAWKYCLHTARNGTNGGVAYLFHGRNLDEAIWNDDTYYTSMLQKHWEEMDQKPPIIITVSFGPVWLLAPKNSAPKSGLLEVFQNEVLPEVESKIGDVTYRAVFGESMGGLNSLIVGLLTQNLFQKVAALCPPVYKSSPFSSVSDLKTSIERTGAVPKIILGLITLAKSYASDEAEWNQFEPLKIMSEYRSKTTSDFYVSAALYDKYGNFEGVDELAKTMKQRNIKTQWRPLYGGHCAVDIVSLADFLR